MPIPWSLALRAIPWAKILAEAPAVAKAADALLARTRGLEGGTPLTDDGQALRDRITALESHTRADAGVLKQLTAQIEALTVASEVLAARVRWLMALVISGGRAGVVAGLLLLRNWGPPAPRTLTRRSRHAHEEAGPYGAQGSRRLPGR